MLVSQDEFRPLFEIKCLVRKPTFVQTQRRTGPRGKTLRESDARRGTLTVKVPTPQVLCGGVGCTWPGSGLKSRHTVLQLAYQNDRGPCQERALELLPHAGVSP